MSARVYLTSGRFVDLPGVSVADVLDELDHLDPDEWFTSGDDDGNGPKRAFRVDAVESVITI